MRAKLKAEWLNPTPWLFTVFLPAGPRNLVFFFPFVSVKGYINGRQ